MPMPARSASPCSSKCTTPARSSGRVGGRRRASSASTTATCARSKSIPRASEACAAQHAVARSIAVSESGLRTADDLARMRALGLSRVSHRRALHDRPGSRRGARGVCVTTLRERLSTHRAVHRHDVHQVLRDDAARRCRRGRRARRRCRRVRVVAEESRAVRPSIGCRRSSRALPRSVLPVGVFVRPSAGRGDVRRRGGIRAVQLHGVDETAGVAGRIATCGWRRRSDEDGYTPDVPRRLPAAARRARSRAPRRHRADDRLGTGGGDRCTAPSMLAGGLHAGNVADAIRRCVRTASTSHRESRNGRESRTPTPCATSWRACGKADR